MSFESISRIAGSAMSAQTVRLNTIASNLANAEAASGVEGDTYRARKPVFATIYENGGSGATPGASVQVLDVIPSDEPLRRMHQPDHPLANEDGDIYLPNVNPVAEMTDMMSASRAFETSVEVLTRTRQMQMAVLRLGES